MATLTLAACADLPPGTIDDPYEEQNRRVHADNVELDRMLFGDGKKKGIIPIIPEPVTEVLDNFASNLAAPSHILNSVLQGRPEPALTNAFRLVVNTTVGIGGVFDPATSLGVEEEETDFGETLHVWGFSEGHYVELPVLGPSTERDTIGFMVDVAIDPIGALNLVANSYYFSVANIGAQIGKRQKYADAYESILYESADSYAQMRLLYLENRRYELGEEAEVIDPYEDTYGQ